jgi:hypothetical protein
VIKENGMEFFIGLGIIVIGLSDNLIRFMLAKKWRRTSCCYSFRINYGIKIFWNYGLNFGSLIISYFIILLKIYYTEYQKRASKKEIKETNQQQLL